MYYLEMFEDSKKNRANPSSGLKIWMRLKPDV
jgi:hypothetical protein